MKDNKMDIKAIQLCVLDIYKKIKQICDENDIRYFAISGTAIGAVRHKGFIPWDDDIDIVMPRKDFRLFAELARQRLPRHYTVIDSTVDPTSQETAMRVCNDRTTMTTVRALRKKDNFLYKGVGVDVIPIDGVPENYYLYRLHRVRLKLLYALNAIANQTNIFSWKPEVLTVIMIGKLLKPFNKRGLFKRAFMSANSKYDFDNSKYLARTWLFASHDGMQATKRYHQEDFSECIDMPFEDTTIRVPVGYDRYLSSLYPNYMTPPSKEKQKPHHFDGIIDLGHSYRYYIAKKEGKVIGYVPGSFDMFHVGHLNIIQKAKQYCDYLIVGVNSNQLMYANKNKYPVVPETERIDIISSIGLVDEAVLVDTPDKMELHDKHKFDVLFVGSDYKGKWNALEAKLAKKGARIHYFDYTTHTSSTKLRDALDDRVMGNKAQYYVKR